MKQWRLLLPILGIGIAGIPYLLKGQQLIGAETALGVLVFLVSGISLVTEYFRIGRGGDMFKKRGRSKPRRP